MNFNLWHLKVDTWDQDHRAPIEQMSLSLLKGRRGQGSIERWCSLLSEPSSVWTDYRVTGRCLPRECCRADAGRRCLPSGTQSSS